MILNSFGIWKPNVPEQLWGCEHIILLVKSGINGYKREGLQTAHWGLYFKWQKLIFFIYNFAAFLKYVGTKLIEVDDLVYEYNNHATAGWSWLQKFKLLKLLCSMLKLR